MKKKLSKYELEEQANALYSMIQTFEEYKHVFDKNDKTYIQVRVRYQAIILELNKRETED